jgi:hypothetical protein
VFALFLRVRGGESISQESVNEMLFQLTSINSLHVICKFKACRNEYKFDMTQTDKLTMADFGVLIFGVCFIFACLILELLLINQNKTTSKITQFMVFQLILNCGPRGSNSFLGPSFIKA